MVANGLYRRDESWNQFRDRDTGKNNTHRAWHSHLNEHRKRWIAVFSEINGQHGLMVKPPYTGPPPLLAGNPAYEGTILGEVWYTEADTPVGPWVYGACESLRTTTTAFTIRDIIRFLTRRGGVHFFEGSFATIYSKAVDKTPRYDYDQLMSGSSMGDPQNGDSIRHVRDLDRQRSAFRDRPGAGSRSFLASSVLCIRRSCQRSTPVYEVIDERRRPGGGSENGGEKSPVFYALPPDAAKPPATARPLFEYVNLRIGQRLYSTGDAALGNP